MDHHAIVKVLREIAMIRASKDLPEVLRAKMIMELQAKIAQLSAQSELLLGPQATNVKVK